VTQNATETATGSRSARTIAAALGGTLVAIGVRRRSLVGTAMALAGGWLLYRTFGRDGRPSRSDEESETQTPTRVGRTVTVGGSADELYEFWRDPQNLTRVVGSFADVTSAGEDRHRWTVAAPLGRTLDWETEILDDRPGELLRWPSAESAPVFAEWSVRFRPAPADRGTEVTLELRLDPPGGPAGSAAMNLLGIVPETLASEALHRFKSLAETGEIATLERNPSGRGQGDLA
jgi:uncharacterized membrane protein